jgi:hypothetical protein
MEISVMNDGRSFTKKKKSKICTQAKYGMPNKCKVGIKCDVTVQVLLFRTVRHEDMPLANAGAAVLEPLGVLSREHYWSIYETVLGWAGERRKFATNFDGLMIKID